VAGHVLAYLAVWPPTKFNDWASTMELKFNHPYSLINKTAKERALQMYNEARQCRLIVECDLIRLPDSSASLRDSTEDRVQSTCPSSEISIHGGYRPIPLGSNIQFQANFNGTPHHFDSAQWILSDIMANREGEDGACSAKTQSDIIVDKKKRYRAKTLNVVVDCLLRHQSSDKFTLSWSDTLHIAGYPGIGQHALSPKYQQTCSLRRIALGPVNMETMFARLSVAIQNCERRACTKKKLIRREVVKMSKADATSWRDDPQLALYKVQCIFPREEQELHNLGGGITDHTKIHADIS
jgi:hypothetical protein